MTAARRRCFYRRSRLTAGLGRRLSRQAGEDRRAVRARRSDRRDGAADRAEAVGKPEAAILRREPSRRRRQYRHDAVARSAPDGYTILVASSSFVVNPSLYAKNPYDAFKDFAPVTLAAASPNILVVNPGRSGQDREGVDRFAEGQSGQIHHRQSRHRHDAATRRRTVQADLQARHRQRAVRRRRPAIQSAVGGHTPIVFSAPHTTPPHPLSNSSNSHYKQKQTPTIYAHR